MLCVKEFIYVCWVYVTFVLMSPSALCRSRPYVIRVNVTFRFTSFMLVSHSGTYVSLGLMLFGLILFGLMSFGLLSFGLMLFVLLSAYPSNPSKKIMHLGSLNNLA